MNNQITFEEFALILEDDCFITEYLNLLFAVCNGLGISIESALIFINTPRTINAWTDIPINWVKNGRSSVFNWNAIKAQILKHE